MHEPLLIPLTSRVQPAGQLDRLVAQVVEHVEQLTRDHNGSAGEASVRTLMVIVLCRPFPLNATVEEPGAECPSFAQVAGDEQVDRAKFAWVFEDRKHLRTLKRFFLMGWAYRNSASSLRNVLSILKPYRERFGVENVPASSRDYSDCVKEITRRFGPSFAGKGTGDVELFARKGEEPAFVEVGHQDTRPIIGLTEAGWRAWMETAHFLALHGGPGPWEPGGVTA